MYNINHFIIDKIEVKSESLVESKVSNNFKIKIIEDGEQNEYILKSKDTSEKLQEYETKDEEKVLDDTKQAEIHPHSEKRNIFIPI